MGAAAELELLSARAAAAVVVEEARGVATTGAGMERLAVGDVSPTSQHTQTYTKQHELHQGHGLPCFQNNTI